MKDKEIQQNEIFKQRARQFAHEKKVITTEFNDLILSFKVNDRNYAIENDFIYRVVPYKKIISLPFAPQEYKGVVNYAGIVWPVLSSGVLLNNEEVECYKNIIFLRDKSIFFAMAIGDVIDHYNYNESTDLMQISTMHGHSNRFLKGVFSPDIGVIDIKKLFAWFKDVKLK